MNFILIAWVYDLHFLRRSTFYLLYKYVKQNLKHLIMKYYVSDTTVEVVNNVW